MTDLQTTAGHVDQPMPVPNDRPAIQDLVIEDMRQRKAVGIARYGTPLQSFNGRDALRDAYEEALDLSQYLRQMIEERESFVARTRAQAWRDAADRIDPGPRRPGTTPPGFDRGVEAGKRSAANQLREWADLAEREAQDPTGEGMIK